MHEATTLPLREGVIQEQPAEPVAARRGFRIPAAWDTALRALVLFLIVQTWILQGYKVFGSCMEPNLATGERLLGSKVALMQGIRRGDVVVFKPPHKPDTAFIKRVVGLPGEVLEIRNNRVYVNDRLLDEPYLRRAWHDDRPPTRIPEHMVYVLGDNRDNSNDSRIWGELPIANIQAKAWYRYWPPDRAGLVR
jgi:signal peptidase I